MAFQDNSKSLICKIGPFFVAGAIMQDNGSVEAGTGFPEPRSADIPNFTLPGSETVLSCQLCRWQSFSPDELLLHMQEYHHIDTEHVVSRQAKTGEKSLRHVK